MATGTGLLASDINSYYIRLNGIRRKFNIPQITPPNYYQGMRALSSDIVAVDNLLTTTANATQWINKDLTLGDISVGARILAQTDTNIKQMLTTWENTCIYHNDCGDYGDYGGDHNNWASDHGVCNDRDSDDGDNVCASVYG